MTLVFHPIFEEALGQFLQGRGELFQVAQSFDYMPDVVLNDVNHFDDAQLTLTIPIRRQNELHDNDAN